MPISNHLSINYRAAMLSEKPYNISPKNAI